MLGIVRLERIDIDQMVEHFVAGDEVRDAGGKSRRSGQVVKDGAISQIPAGRAVIIRKRSRSGRQFRSVVVRFGNRTTLLATPECWSKQHQQREQFQASQQHGDRQKPLANGIQRLRSSLTLG